MSFWYKTALNLTEDEIRYAMANSKTNREAAQFIGCHESTLRTYAKRYIDKETGLNLWELHKNKGNHTRKAAARAFSSYKQTVDIFEILDGKRPNYGKARFIQRLLDEKVFPEECANCGFEERRITDYKMPLVLVWKDGNTKNHKQENLEFVCYNCYFIMYDDILTKKQNLNFKGV